MSKFLATRPDTDRGRQSRDQRSSYVWGDTEAENEFARLTKLSRFMDELSRARISEFVVGTNARCLEIGPGTGSMSRWMAEHGCSVLAIDVSDRFFAGITHERIELRVGDVRDSEIESGFDLIFVRLLLHHLPERREVVKKLAGLLRPGGTLVAEEPQVELMKTLSGADALEFFRDLPSRFLQHGVDFNCGSQLHEFFAAAGLERIDAVGQFSLAFEGSQGSELMRSHLALLEKRLVPLGELTVEDFELRKEQIAASDFVGTSPITISCRGRRPS
jgi:2-polyprenyl-3-methyl-5-hydroxy-6-metoxy-1,4-benzoquinol methylase